MKIQSLFMILFILLGCGEGFHYKVSSGEQHRVLREVSIYVDIQMISDADLVKKAVDDWNFALNGYVKLNIVDWKFDMSPEVIKRAYSQDSWLILSINSSSYLIPNNSKKVLAWVNEIGGKRMYVISDRVSTKDLDGILRHEIGHLMGAKHDKVYLMKPYYDWSDYKCVDYYTMSQVADNIGLDVSKFNYCIYDGSAKLPSVYTIYPN